MPGVKGRSGGHNRKPTALKVLQGNPGRRPIDDSKEAKPELAIPACPEELDEDARKEWERLVPELFRLGLLSRIDRGALAAYCVAWSDFVQAVKDPKAFRARHEAMKSMHRFMVEFGLTPASRTRVKVEPQDIQAVPEDEAFLRARGLKVVK